MAKKKKINGYNRNAVKWTPLVQAIVPEDAKKQGVVACAQNAAYTVFIEETTSPGFEMPGPDGRPMPMPIRHLIVVRNDRKKKEIRWSHKQRIKDELCGPMCEAVELFPVKWRVQDVTQTHLWVMAPGASFPLGLFPENFAGGQTPADVTVTKEEIEVFVVRGEGYIEVFADEEEAKEAYDKTGNAMGSGGIERIGDVPTSDDGAAWTDRAKAKVANIIAKAEAMDRMNTPKPDDDTELPFYDDGPSSVEEESDPELNFDMGLLKHQAQLVYGPPSDEENIQIAEYMKEKLAEIAARREVRVKDASDAVAEKLEKQEEDSSKEEDAAADLAEYRRQLRDGGDISVGKKGDDKPN